MTKSGKRDVTSLVASLFCIDLLEIFTECAVIAMVFHGAGPAALCLDWLFSCVVGVSLSYLLECQYASLA